MPTVGSYELPGPGLVPGPGSCGEAKRGLAQFEVLPAPEPDVRERERERESVCVCVRERERKTLTGTV